MVPVPVMVALCSSLLVVRQATPPVVGAGAPGAQTPEQARAAKALAVRTAADGYRAEIVAEVTRLQAEIAAPTVSPRAKRALERKLELRSHNLGVFDDVLEHAQISGRLHELDANLLRNEFQVEALRHPYQRGNFSWQVLAGGEIAEDDDSFSSPTGYLRFVGDTAFRPTDESRGTWKNWHGVVDLALSTIPVEDDSTGTTFIESEKALTAAVGLDLYFYQHPPSEDGFRTQVGLTSRVGLQTLDDSAGTDLSSENEFWELGLAVRTSPRFRYSDPNPLPYAYAALTYGEYDTLEDHVFAFDGMIRFVPDEESALDNEDPWGLFIGMRALVNVDDGDDDLRFQFGVQDGLALVKDLFRLPTQLFSGGDDDEG